MRVANRIELNGERIRLNASEIVYKDENITKTITEFIGEYINSGSNPNGHYIRLNDGTQICNIVDSNNLSQNNLQANERVEIVWEYPIPFIQTPTVIPNPGINALGNNRVLVSADRSPGLASCPIYLTNTSTSTITAILRVSAMAIGRWK